MKLEHSSAAGGVAFIVESRISARGFHRGCRQESSSMSIARFALCMFSG